MRQCKKGLGAPSVWNGRFVAAADNSGFRSRLLFGIAIAATCGNRIFSERTAVRHRTTGDLQSSESPLSIVSSGAACFQMLQTSGCAFNLGLT